MKYMSGFWPGYVLGIFTLIGCASVFPYRFYGTKMDPICYDQGTLLGHPGGWPDLPLEECKPDGVNKLKCITLKDSDFYDLKADDEKCHADLQICQKGTP